MSCRISMSSSSAFPGPHVQGSRLDRDMHAAQFAVLLEEMPVPDR